MRVMSSDGLPLTLRGVPAEAVAVAPRPRATARTPAVRTVRVLLDMGGPRFRVCAVVDEMVVPGRPPDPRGERAAQVLRSVELVHGRDGRLLEGLHRGAVEAAHLPPVHDRDGP